MKDLHEDDRARRAVLGVVAALTVLALPPSTFVAALVFTAFFLGLAASVAGDPHSDERTERIIADLCERAGLPVPELRRAPTKDVFASARGIRPKRRRLVLSDGAMALPDDELRAVVAHELGHYAAWDILDAVVWLPAVLAMFHVSGIAASYVYDAAANVFDAPLPENLGAGTYVLPGFLLVLGALATNRWSEERADRYAVELTKDPSALRSVLSSLPAKERWPEALSAHPRMGRRLSRIPDGTARASTPDPAEGEGTDEHSARSAAAAKDERAAEAAKEEAAPDTAATPGAPPEAKAAAAPE